MYYIYLNLTEEVDVVHANVERSVDLELELPVVGVVGVVRVREWVESLGSKNTI